MGTAFFRRFCGPGRRTCLLRLGLAFCFFAVVFLLFVPVVEFSAPRGLAILDRGGRLLGAVTARDGQWRFGSPESLPEKYRLAVIEFEDHRFYSHPGVDPLAILRALRQDLSAGKVISGASTITMQVVRLSRKGRPRSLGEKLIECFLALRLELAHSKKEILLLYAGHAPFGGNTVGIRAASWRYFSRSPEDLSWAEAATLAVLPNAPAMIHPGRKMDRLREKRNDLLLRLFQRGIIDETGFRLAEEEPLPGPPRPMPRMAPHLLDRVRKEYPLGGVITTSIDLEIQRRSLEIAEAHHRLLHANGIESLAALIADTRTGEVLAYIGNVGSGQEDGAQVDCIMAPRSSGSILKPFLYAGMMEDGEILPDQLVADIPTRIAGFAPRNFDHRYSGAVPASVALSRSLNVPAVRMLRAHGIGRFADLLRRLGLRTLFRPADDYGLSLILGGAEVRLWEMTGLYAGLGRSLLNDLEEQNPGADFHPLMWHPGSKDSLKNSFPVYAPRCATDLARAIEQNRRRSRVYVEDFAIEAGSKLSCRWDAKTGSYFCASPNGGPASPFNSGVVWTTLKALEEVARPGIDSSWKNFSSSRHIAWKTGTSYGFRDAWALGLSPRFTIGVWAGNADGEGRPGLTGHSAAAPLLFSLFESLPASPFFDEPEVELRSVEVCSRSGFIAGKDCAEKREMRVPLSCLPGNLCPYCRRVHLDTSGVFRVDAQCEEISSIRHRSYFILPPIMATEYRKGHPEYAPLPPWRRDCRPEQGEDVLSCIYPGPGAKLYIPLELDGRRGRLVAEAADGDPRATLYWYLDEDYLGETQGEHRMAIAPDPGSHRLTLVDSRGERLSRNFIILSRE